MTHQDDDEVCVMGFQNSAEQSQGEGWKEDVRLHKLQSIAFYGSLF